MVKLASVIPEMPMDQVTVQEAVGAKNNVWVSVCNETEESCCHFLDVRFSSSGRVPFYCDL